MFKKLFLFALLGVAFSSCSNFNSVKVKKTNFENEVLRAQNLVFTFNKELLPDTGLINKWDTTQYISFEPKIPGKFMWTGKSELTFSPLGALLPASDYKATLNTDLTKYSPAKYSVDDDPLLFHSPFLAISSINSFWSLSEDMAKQVEVRCQLNFNNPVSPSKLKPLLKLLVSGKEMPYRIITQNDAESIEVAFAYDSQSGDKETKGEMIVAKGLACTGGNTITKDEIKSELLIPSKDKLTITNAESGFDNGKGFIDVFTSQPIIAEGLAKFISTNPPLNLEAELLTNGFRIKGEFLGSQTYTLKI
ncbi:MAG: hypothetical protein WCK81_15660, partial [Betaproteobacteria bacterium]